MAKRKRLTPAKITEAATGAPETKSAFPRYPNGVAATRTHDPEGPARTIRPPIADVAQDASASAALTEIAQTLSDARAEGRLIQRLPLDRIQVDYLVRDRIATDADDMKALQESLRVRGQQTAIEVTALDDGEYGLISGWRRVAALRALALEDPNIDSVLAIVRTPADAADAYQAMVEENEIRVGLSFFERARIVVRAVDAGVFKRDRVALAKLFHAASRPKRSKIGSFVRIVRGLEDVLRFPTQMSERTGLALAQAIIYPSDLEHMRAALRDGAVRDASEEAERIMAVIAGPAPSDAPLETAADPQAETSVLLPESPRPAPVHQQLRPGLQMKETAKGDIVLSGTVLRDPAFREGLMMFLKN